MDFYVYYKLYLMLKFLMVMKRIKKVSYEASYRKLYA